MIRKRNKAKPVLPFKGIDASLIIQNTDMSEHDFMSTLYDYAPAPSETILLKPWVNFNSNGRIIAGPEMDRQNRMTLEEYYVFSN